MDVSGYFGGCNGCHVVRKSHTGGSCCTLMLSASCDAMAEELSSSTFAFLSRQKSQARETRRCLPAPFSVFGLDI